MLLEEIKDKYRPDELWVELHQDTYRVYVFTGATDDAEALYTHDFGTMKVAKAIARAVNVPVVKNIRTQVTYYNVDGSKRGYGKEKHVGVL
tara:strand:+ start:280 stop:552 length:273 start_codon:yes stop_codon:yes gene_type:complete